MHVAGRIAERALAITYESLPPEAIQWAKVGLLDYIGCTIAGATEPAAKIAADVMIEQSNAGSSAILGRRERIPSLEAAVVNGTASHALDYDDISNTMGGHPSAPLLSALLALADEGRYSGKALLAAYIAGFEVETKIARGVHFHHYTKGWHPTSTLGVFGVAAACSHLLQLDASRTTTALAIAASSSAGIKANFGTMTKPLHVGLCARGGMLAAKLAARGFTASANAFEHKQGFLDVYNGSGHLRRRAHLRAVRIAARHREPGHRDQTISLLRQHAFRAGCDAVSRAQPRGATGADHEDSSLAASAQARTYE